MAMSAWRIELADNDTGPADWRLPVLALHGAASSGSQWHGLSDYLRGRYRGGARNLPGYRTRRRRGALDLGDMADSVVNGLSHRGPLHVVGHSHGAAVALEIAIRRPEFVRSLTLIEPSVYHLLRGGDAADLSLVKDLESLSDWMAASLAADYPAAGMRAYVDFWYGAGAWDRTSRRLRQTLASDTERVSLDLATSLAQSWTATRFKRVVCPTLAMMALESHAASLRVTEVVAKAISGARLVMIPEAGHMAPLTDPHIIDPLIAAHLKFVDRFRPTPAASRWVQ